MREKTIVQTCIDLLRNFFNYASKRNCAQLAEDLKLLYRAQSEFGALDRSAEFSGNRESANAAWYYPHRSPLATYRICRGQPVRPRGTAAKTYMVCPAPSAPPRPADVVS